MYLNTLQPSEGSRKVKKRLGRGIGSGLGKTCGKGHKGQKARSGGYHKIGFEGGQMPMQRRLPKFGFVSRASLEHTEVRLSDLKRLDGDEVTIASLKKSGIISHNIKTVKIFASGKVEKAYNVINLPISAGAAEAIKAVGGSVSIDK